MDTTPVTVLAHRGPDELVAHLAELTIRRVGRNRPVHVLRHTGDDVIRASARPYYVVGISRFDGSIVKLSWHHSEEAALERIDRSPWPNVEALAVIDASEVGR